MPRHSRAGDIDKDDHKAEAQRRYRQERAVAAGPDADARRRRDAALRCERQKKYRARLVSSARTHTLDELPPAMTDAQTSTDSRAVCELQRHRQPTPAPPSLHTPRSLTPRLTSTWQDSTWQDSGTYPSRRRTASSVFRFATCILLPHSDLLAPGVDRTRARITGAIFPAYTRRATDEDAKLEEDAAGPSFVSLPSAMHAHTHLISQQNTGTLASARCRFPQRPTSPQRRLPGYHGHRRDSPSFCAPSCSYHGTCHRRS